MATKTKEIQVCDWCGSEIESTHSGVFMINADNGMGLAVEVVVYDKHNDRGDDVCKSCADGAIQGVIDMVTLEGKQCQD